MRTFVYQKENVREELPQEEKNDEKTRGPELQKMPEEGGENEKVEESESEKVAEPLPANKKRIEAKNYLQRQGHGQFITFEVKTERSYRREIRAGRKNFTETNLS